MSEKETPSENYIPLLGMELTPDIESTFVIEPISVKIVGTHVTFMIEDDGDSTEPSRT